jgi:NodT family efflux transporter outer membrane factor (OMF) lipoprotein
MLKPRLKALPQALCRALRAAGCAVALACAGCASPTAWQVPQADVPARWSQAVQPGQMQSDWWLRFGDAQLNALMAQALRANADLAAAAIRVRVAQLQAGLADGDATPGLAVSANVGASRALRGGANTTATAQGSGASALLSYEVDLWGRLGAQRDAARWRAQASAADCQATALALSGTVATLHWQLARLNQLIALGEADIAYAVQTRELTEAKFQAGAVSGLARAQAGIYLANQRALQAQWLQQRQELRHARATLLGQPPDSPQPEPTSLPEAELPDVAAGLPAEVLAQRPDLHAAELRLREALGNVEIARTSFYPSLTLTGGVNTASDSLLGLLRNPVAVLGAGLALPFVHWNTRSLTLRVSEAQYEAAVVGFRQSLYTALAEVEDALTARAALVQMQREWQQARREAAQA